MAPMIHLAWMVTLKVGITMTAPGLEAYPLGTLIMSTRILLNFATLIRP
jgi:hypothetical protein